MSETVQSLLSSSIKALRAAGIDQGPIDARYLMAAALGLPKDRLTLHLRDTVSVADKVKFQNYVAMRCTHTPVSHIIGERVFFGLTFKVSADVLDPRPETEILVKTALREPFGNVLDLGTGSGCILLSLLDTNTDAQGLGTDLSVKALKIAAQNSKLLGVESPRISFLQSHWFSNIDQELRFDLIVSNPPYISQEEMKGLAQDVYAYEPHLALSDASDGLQCYRNICADVCTYLNDGGRVIFEIGATQASDVISIMIQNGLSDIQLIQDFGQKDRVLVGKYYSNATS